MLVLCFALSLADPPKTPPSLDVVRKAFKEHAERLKYGRVKLVVVKLSGRPKSVFPPLDSPDREEIEEIYAPDGRMLEKVASITGVQKRTRDFGFDGVRWVLLEGFSQPDNRIHFKAKVAKNRDQVGVPLNWVNQLLPPSLGGPRPFTLSPGDQRFLLLSRVVDDRERWRSTYTLDPAKGFWPISMRSEWKDDQGSWQTTTESQVVEFMEVGGRILPRRMTSCSRDPRPAKSERQVTTYFTITTAEFPVSFSDDAFRIAIPDGTDVFDFIERGPFTQPSPVATSKDSTAEVGRAPSLVDWMINLAFLSVFVLAAAGARYLIMQRFPEMKNRT